MRLFNYIASIASIVLIVIAITGCQRETRVSSGIRGQVLHVGNGTEPQDLDPHSTAGGEPEHKVMMALLEGLTGQDPQDLHPVPGMADRWDISDDRLIYTFHLRTNGFWSNGEPVTAQDFVGSFERMLMPELASEYSYMLFPMTNAEEFTTGKIKNFEEVGAKALDARTLQITLRSPTPYFLSILSHNSWFPVHLPTVKKFGGIADRGNRWTLPGNFVGNGPFILKEWKMNSYIMVEKNPWYWDAANVKLNRIYFYPTESIDAEERAFRAGMLHITKDVPSTKIEVYKKNHPEQIRAEPILSTYFYRFNVMKPPLNDKRVRQALVMAVDREAIVKYVTRGGQVPAYFYTPPNTGGYTCRSKIDGNVEKARRLLAEAGYPDGKNFPEMNILINTHEAHKAIAEAIQQMWMKNLNVRVSIRNEEWKVFLDSTHRLNYQIARAGWNGDYLDPNTFLDMFITDGGNNDTGWSNKEYDRLIQEAALAVDPKERLKIFQKAEAILLDEVPILPLYFYTRPTLLHPSVRNFYPTVLDLHPWQAVYLDPNWK